MIAPSGRCTCADNKRECDCGMPAARPFADSKLANLAVSLALVAACIVLALVIPMGST